MKEGLDFAKEVLKELSSAFPSEDSFPFIMVSNSGNLMFNFVAQEGRHAFELSEEDLSKSPELIVSEVKKDLNL
jgi:hypothetical protein